MAEFTHLHVHSDFSLLDGLGRIPLLAEVAQEQEFGALALTDHGVMFGAIDFYSAMKDRGIKPIIGYEAYVAAGSRFDREGSSYHLTLLAENLTGYENLMQLTSKGHLEGFYRKPRVDHELLELHKEGVICLSGCASSEICRALQEKNDDSAESLIEWYHSVYGDRFYLELQDHGIDFQAPLNDSLICLSKRMNIPVVATNDVHYVRPEQASVHDVLLCVQTQTTMTDPKRMKMDTQAFYLKPADEMEQIFGHVVGALKNTMAIAERCDLQLEFGTNQLLPEAAVPEGVAPEKYLRDLCELGIETRYGADQDPTVSARLDYELSVIEKTGYVAYMLLVNEFIQFAHEKDIAIGVRGSAGGSLVGYALGITNVDPLELGLSFERFLNPERVSMPDIDIDIADDRRDELIQYVTNRFGRDRVAQIISFGTMAARAALRDVGRATGVPAPSVDRIAKLVPFSADLGEALKTVTEFKLLYEEDPVIKGLVDSARDLEGVTRHASTHAAGVVISAEPLWRHVPLYKVPKSEAVTTQYAMDPLDKLGLLKMDFLGLRTLTVVQRALARVQETTGRHMTTDDIPLEDPAAFELLGRGETFGIFQVDGSGMRRLLREMRPDRFDDIIALIALYRPGPMQFIDDFVKRRNGSAKVTYRHPSLENVLRDTYGIVVYQEQVVRMVVEIAGFSAGQGDLVRKAMAKKQPEQLAKYRKDFVAGAVEKGTAANDAEQLFDIIQEFSGYGFNKAHSAAYAVITCQTAYLKAHFPVEFMAAFVSAERENADKVGEALGECRRLRIPVLPPDVNHSESDFAIQESAIRFGLSAIKNVGNLAAASIVDERKANGPYASVGDFCRRMDWQQVNKRTIEALIKCGALDRLGDRGRLDFNLDRLVAYGSKAAADAASGQVNLFGELETETLEPHLEPGSNGDQAAWLRWEKDMIGAYLSHHPLEDYADRLVKLGVRPITDIDAESDGQTVTVGGILSDVRAFTTKRGDQMATLTINDLDGSLDGLLYARTYRKYADLVKVDNIVVVTGTISVSDTQPELRIDTVLPIDSAELDENLIEREAAEAAGSVSRAEPAAYLFGAKTQSTAGRNGSKSGASSDPLREPIPFPFKPRETGPATPAVQMGLFIEFNRTENREADLDRVKAVYSALRRHPGRDRVVLLVRGDGRSKALDLPIDTAGIDEVLKAEIAGILPDAGLRVERIGA